MLHTILLPIFNFLTLGLWFLFEEPFHFQYTSIPITINRKKFADPPPPKREKKKNSVKAIKIVLKQGPREAVVWLAAHHHDKKALQFLNREIAPAGTGMGMRSISFSFTRKSSRYLPAPGLTAIVGGRPKVYVNFSKNFITLTKFIIAGLLC
jgi:hypothetical protein